HGPAAGLRLRVRRQASPSGPAAGLRPRAPSPGPASGPRLRGAAMCQDRGMRAVLQRVDGAQVEVDGELIGAVAGEGLLALVGVTHEDGPEQVSVIARKICELRILEGERSVLDTGAQVLVVSQFTLYGDARKGRRPSWQAAAPGAMAEPLVEQVVEAIR